MFEFLSRLVDPFSPGAALPPGQKVWPFLKAHLAPFRWVLGLSLVLTLIGALIEVWLIGYTGQLVDLLARTEPGLVWQEHGAEFVAVAAVVLILRPLAHVLRESLDDLAFRPNATTLFRWRAHRHVLRQSVGWFQNDFAGRIASRVQDIGGSAPGIIYSVVHTLSYVVIYVIGAFSLLASIDLRLVIPLAIWLVLYLGLMAFAVPRLRTGSERYQEAYSAINGLLVDTYGNIDTVKLFAPDSGEDRAGRAVFERAQRVFVDVQKVEVTVNGTMMFLSSVLIVSLVGLGIALWQAGSAPLGLVAAALALSFRITGMAEWMLDAVSAFFMYLGSLSEQLKMVGQPILVTDRQGASDLVIGKGAVRFSDVSHHYGRGSGGLAGVSLDIAGGQKVGLVGRSGAGKSTLVNLLLRFFDAEGGTITVDGQDIAGVTQASLRRQISMVGQNATLLHRSVGDNIAFGREDMGQAQIEAAASKAAAEGFIPGLVDQEGRRGYDAHVGERGVKLSGGQRQRIALARAILKEAPILILDEATSALDSEVEAAIQDTLYGVMEGKTVIAIAHRLSTIAHMDRIVVLDNGRVVEDGTHAELLALGGVYARLWSRQSGGFLGIED